MAVAGQALENGRSVALYAYPNSELPPTTCTETGQKLLDTLTNLWNLCRGWRHQFYLRIFQEGLKPRLGSIHQGCKMTA
ncbi:hypothetical protein B566_EDAN016594 [Ephemera danica]|nr:hypothetical protein B566_EDAN016594 [Ephemera danica]